ncbi:hypothetical protein [Natrinema soli]|nr:hypothetical protein [Natrinema soli]
MTDDETVDIREVQTVKLRHSKGSIVVRITDAIRAAGVEDGSFRFDPHAAEEIGMVPAIAMEERVDGRTDPLTCSIHHEGAGGTMSISLPRDVLEELGIDPDGIDWDNPPELNVWAGDQLLAFELPDERTVQVSRGGDSKDDA